MPETTTEVTVLGAGAVGICCALSLAERGAKVRLIDRGDPGQETSYGNAGVISPWSVIPQTMPGLWKKLPSLMFGQFRPLSVRAATWPRMVPWGLSLLRQGTEARVREIADGMELLCAPSDDLYRRHLQGTGHEHLVRDSVYVHAFRDASRASLSSLDCTIRREKGAQLELIGADGLRALEPALSSDFKAAVVIHGQARALAPGRIHTVLAQKAEKLGVEILRSEVRAVIPDGSRWAIETDQGRRSTDKVVVALGAWSKPLLDALGIKLPLMAERGYHVEFPEPGVTLNNSVTDTDAKFVMSSMEGGLRVAGQAEFGPVDAPPDPRVKTRLSRLAHAALPDLAEVEPRFWMGRRPSFADSLPVIDRLGARDGLYGCFGHSHYGLMMAPKSGDILADLVLGQPINHDLSAYSAARFG